MTSWPVTASRAATASGVGGGAAATGATASSGTVPALRMRRQHEGLDLAPQLVLVGFAPDVAHLGQRVAVYHAPILPHLRQALRWLARPCPSPGQGPSSARRSSAARALGRRPAYGPGGDVAAIPAAAHVGSGPRPGKRLALAAARSGRSRRRSGLARRCAMSCIRTVDRRSSLKDVGAGNEAGLVNAVDHVAADRGTPGYPSAARTTVTAAPGASQLPRRRPGRRQPLRPAGRRAGVSEPVQHDLRLRVAEPGVELDHARTARGQGQARRTAGRCMAVPRRASSAAQACTTVVQGLLSQARGRPRQRRVRSHAPGIRAFIAVPGSLEVLRRAAGDGGVGRPPARRPIPRAVKELLDNDRAAYSRMAQGLGPVLVTITPLPAARPSALTT